jgi:hypothetical protein
MQDMSEFRSLSRALAVHASEVITEDFESMPETQAFEMLPDEEYAARGYAADPEKPLVVRHLSTGRLVRLIASVVPREEAGPAELPGQLSLFA